jgi:hypothetical protein
MAIPLVIITIIVITEITAVTGFIQEIIMVIIIHQTPLLINNPQSNKGKIGKRKDLRPAIKF